MPGPSTYTQKTKDALTPLVGASQAAMLCSIRGAGRSATKEELVAAFNMLFDAVTPNLEATHAFTLRRLARRETGEPDGPARLVSETPDSDEEQRRNQNPPELGQKPCSVCEQRHDV